MRPAALLAALLLALATGSPAQDLPVLVVDQERVFGESLFGARVQKEIDDRSEALAAENRAIEAELTAEERTLTERRAELSPRDFRPLADAFDEKVQRLRDEQDAKEREIVLTRERERRAFAELIGPVLVDLMRETGALVVLDERSVLVTAGPVDITDRVIVAIDAAVGDGTDATAADAPASEPGAGLPATDAPGVAPAVED